MSEEAQPAPSMRHTKTFKKYTDEYDQEVVDHVREWGSSREGIVFHEDNSIVKVTGVAEKIDSLLGELKKRYDYIPPEERESGDS